MHMTFNKKILQFLFSRKYRCRQRMLEKGCPSTEMIEYCPVSASLSNLFALLVDRLR